MKTKEWQDYPERWQFRPGPWRDEPDRIQWRDEATGLPCLMARGGVGAWCGYVGVDQTSSLYGKDYMDIEKSEIDFSVHGGLTYSSFCQGRVCHEVEPGEDDQIWWLGFDCCHSGDLTAIMHRPYHATTEIYRDVDYVKREVVNLARQIKEYESQ